MRATVIVDASFCPQLKVGGWAAWVRFDDKVLLKEHGVIRSTEELTATKAEAMAAVNGVWLAARRGAVSILLQSDCMAVVDMIQGFPSPKIEHIWQELFAALPDHELTISGRHVKGHTFGTDARSWVNNWCHDQAYSAMKTARNKKRKERQRERRIRTAADQANRERGREKEQKTG